MLVCTARMLTHKAEEDQLPKSVLGCLSTSLMLRTSTYLSSSITGDVPWKPQHRLHALKHVFHNRFPGKNKPILNGLRESVQLRLRASSPRVFVWRCMSGDI